ncbi:hypothetical protein C8R42DRAFT_690582 [Lentinula raphanica]|nr:hypothetical protein C8R42DRAFT_690582 [Lentinula raphanica]
MRFRVVCFLSAAVLFCVVSVAAIPLPATSPMPPATSPLLPPASKPQKKNYNLGIVRIGLRTGFGEKDDWLMLTEGLEKRKQATPLVCFSSYFCIGYDKVGGVNVVEMKTTDKRRYFVELPVTTTNLFRQVWKAYRDSMQNVRQLLEESQRPQSALNSDTFIPIVVESASRHIISADLPHIPKIIDYVHALKKPNVVDEIASLVSNDPVSQDIPLDTTNLAELGTSKDGAVKLYVGFFQGTEPLSLRKPLEERKKADLAVCYASYFCLYYGKDSQVHRADLKKAGRGSRPARGFYVELPVRLSTVFRRKYDQEKYFNTMMSIDSLLMETKTDSSDLNRKSFIPITIKSVRNLLLPWLSQTQFDKILLPHIDFILDQLVPSDARESTSFHSSEPTAQNMDVDTMGSESNDALERPDAEAMDVDTPSMSTPLHDHKSPGDSSKESGHDYKSVGLTAPLHDQNPPGKSAQENRLDHESAGQTTPLHESPGSSVPLHDQNPPHNSAKDDRHRLNFIMAHESADPSAALREQNSPVNRAKDGRHNLGFIMNN